MGRVFVHMSVSVDGFFEGPRADISWHLVDAEVHGYVNDVLRPVATYLVGRRSYELMQAYWPTADLEPDVPPEIRDFAEQWRSTPKVVASRTLASVADGDSLVREVDADVVRSLASRSRQQQGGQAGHRRDSLLSGVPQGPVPRRKALHVDAATRALFASRCTARWNAASVTT